MRPASDRDRQRIVTRQRGTTGQWAGSCVHHNSALASVKGKAHFIRTSHATKGEISTRVGGGEEKTESRGGTQESSDLGQSRSSKLSKLPSAINARWFESVWKALRWRKRERERGTEGPWEEESANEPVALFAGLSVFLFLLWALC